MFFLTNRYHRFAEQAERISDIFLFDRFCDRHQNKTLERLLDGYYIDNVDMAKRHCQLSSATRSWRGFIQSFIPGTTHYRLRKDLSQALTRTHSLYDRIMQTHHQVVFDHHQERVTQECISRWTKRSKKPTRARPNVGLRLFQHPKSPKFMLPLPSITPCCKASASN